MFFSKIFFFIFKCLAQLKILVKPKMIFKLTQKKKKKEEESLHKGVNCFMPLRKHKKNLYLTWGNPSFNQITQTKGRNPCSTTLLSTSLLFAIVEFNKPMVKPIIEKWVPIILIGKISYRRIMRNGFESHV